MTRSRTTQLLTTRSRIAVAVGLTALVLAQAIRGLRWSHTGSSWLMSSNVAFHGWPMIAVNVFIYGYMCWLGFWFIRGTVGKERVFMAGWFADILPSPLRMLRPEWVAIAKYVGAFGLAVALLAALALLLDRSDVADSDGTTEAR